MDVTARQDRADFEMSGDYSHLKCHGLWIIGHLSKIEAEIKTIVGYSAHEITVDMSEVASFDSAGALLIQKLIFLSKKKKKAVKIVGLENHFVSLLEIIAKEVDYKHTIKPHHFPNGFYVLGRWMVNKLIIFLSLFSFFGEVLTAFGHAIRHPRYFSWRSILSVFHSNC